MHELRMWNVSNTESVDSGTYFPKSSNYSKRAHIYRLIYHRYLHLSKLKLHIRLQIVKLSNCVVFCVRRKRGHGEFNAVVRNFVVCDEGTGCEIGTRD